MPRHDHRRRPQHFLRAADAFPAAADLEKIDALPKKIKENMFESCATRIVIMSEPGTRNSLRPQDGGACGCGPHGGPRAQEATPYHLIFAANAIQTRQETVSIPGGRAEIGTDQPFFPADGEGPRRVVSVRPFAVDVAAVTNERFARFVDATGYVTEAERFGWSFVFYQHVVKPETCPHAPGAEWWLKVDGAMWRHPEGPGSHISDRRDHPVVHVSHSDALTFAAWNGGRLPTEAEWEHAARGGLRGARFPWGEAEPTDAGPYPCNIWQGTFPTGNSDADGFDRTAPAQSFEPNGYGLYNMSGNVWEWCADRFRVQSLQRAARRLNDTAQRERRFVQKGGSFLCHKSYCYRYRIAARIGNPPDTTTSHAGFRLVYEPSF